MGRPLRSGGRVRRRRGAARRRRRRRVGKSLTPPPGGGRPDSDDVKEGDAAREAVADAARRTTSRRDLARHERFEQISPEVGVLDPDAFAEAMQDDADDALALLAELTGATDERLRDLARRLAGRVMVDLGRIGPERRRGVGRLRRVPRRDADGDIDLDSSLDAVAAARAGVVTGDELRVAAWQRPSTAVCLLVDRSGSMAGDRLAAAAVAAAAVIFRAPLDCSVVAFAEDAIVLKAQDEVRDPDEVVADLLRLRGFGVTDLGLALRTAAAQLARSTAGRRITLLMSDCRVTAGGDALVHAAGTHEVAVLAPNGDTADAEAFADALGARWTELAGPTSVPDAISTVLLG
ncbi:MAG TPA: VWA domain-containing protein [Microthrixaceae bacterium]|nr:VWA domain-containing protein [Microthrixaceae bacterium]HNO44914.1 VWA domain-containing protein [Microthrixaceae bacterium]